MKATKGFSTTLPARVNGASLGASSFQTGAKQTLSARDVIATLLAQHFVDIYGAPSIEAARGTALDEIDQMAELCADHAPNTLLTVTRELTPAGVRESFRMIEAQQADIMQFAVHGHLDDEPHSH